jgi:hypothetical protein
MNLEERNKMLKLEKIIEDLEREIAMLNSDLLLWEGEFNRVAKKHKDIRFTKTNEILCTPDTCKK